MPGGYESAGTRGASVKFNLQLARRAMKYLLLALALLFLASACHKVYLAATGSESIALALVENGAGKRLFYFLLFLFLYVGLSRGLLRRMIRGPSRDTWINTALTSVSLVVGLLAMELALRPFGVVFSAANQIVEAKISDDGKRAAWSKPHKDIGYVPVTGRGPHGELPSAYPAEKTSEMRRALFVGDSIAELRFLEKAVQARQPDSMRYQFWNIGVSGYSTVQERLYFEEFGRGLKPDLVILEFCLNDFDGTPVVFKDEKEGFVVLVPQMGRDEYNQWMFLNSTLYRFYLSLKKSLFIDPRGRPGRLADMKANMARFKAMAQEDGFRFKVVIYPTLDLRAKWTQNDNTHYQAILAILEELRIEAHDLTPVLERALVQHPVKWTRFLEQDKIHPSQAFAGMAAEHLLDRGLLK